MSRWLDRRRGMFIAMWGVALAAVVFIWLRQPGPAPGEPVVAGGAPVHRFDGEPAPPERRAGRPLAALAAGPPTMFRHDRRHTARSATRGPSQARRAWSYATGGRVTAQATVGADGTIFVASHDRHLHALSAYGQLRWKRDLGDRIYATPLVDDEGNVYVGSDADTFFALSRTGEVRWRLAVEGDADTGATLGADGDLRFAAGRSLYCVGTDGRVRWRFDARAKIYTTPALDDDDTAYVGSQDDHVYAVAADGRMRWSYRTRDDVDSSPVLGDEGRVFFGSDDHHVYALDRDGALLWSTDLDGYVRAPVALGADGSLVASVFGPHPRVVALDAATGDLRWYFPLAVVDSAEAGSASGPVVDADGSVYVGAHDGYVYALASTGDLRWVYETGEAIDASAALGPDGTLLIGSNDRSLHAFRLVEPGADPSP